MSRIIKYTLLSFLLFFSFSKLFAQRDLIITQAGEEIRCKILDETPIRFIYAYLGPQDKVLRNEIFKNLVSSFKYNHYSSDLLKNDKLKSTASSKTSAPRIDSRNATPKATEKKSQDEKSKPKKSESKENSLNKNKGNVNKQIKSDSVDNLGSEAKSLAIKEPVTQVNQQKEPSKETKVFSGVEGKMNKTEKENPKNDNSDKQLTSKEEIKSEEKNKSKDKIKTEEKNKPVGKIITEEKNKPEDKIITEEKTKPEEKIKIEEKNKPEEKIKSQEYSKPVEEIKTEENSKPIKEIKTEEKNKLEDKLKSEEKAKTKKDKEEEEKVSKKELSPLAEPEVKSEFKNFMKYRVGAKGGLGNIIQNQEDITPYGLYKEKLLRGWMFGVDAAIFLNDHIGLGATYTNYQSFNKSDALDYPNLFTQEPIIKGNISNSVSHKFVGPTFLYRKAIDFKTFAVLTISPGMHLYTDKGITNNFDFKFKGQAYGAAATLGIDFLLGNDIFGRDIILSLEGGYNYGQITKLDKGTSEGLQTLASPINLNRLDFTVGLRFTRFPLYLR